MKTKTCSKCKSVKPLSDFFRDNRSKSGLYSSCKQCYVRWNEKNPEKAREARIKKQYGISILEYENMYELQEGKCKICKSYISILLNSPNIAHIDHDHSDGKVRGLLCSHCNSLLGMAKDNIQILQNAIKYLTEQSNGKEIHI